jgi:GrpB-like predicted nucleotidyltransferase (UPF0157 family)
MYVSLFVEVLLDIDAVIIVDYNPQWPSMYEQEKTRIQSVIGEYLIDIQHVGSTSIPGLSAKPIIDIMAVIRNISFVEQCVKPLEALDYAYKGEGGIPGRHFFRKPTDIPRTGRTFHMHMVEKGHEQWAMYQLFREYLRLHPESVQQYDTLKRELAAKHGADREAYTDAKAPFIRSILRAAVIEAMHEKKKSVE